MSGPSPVPGDPPELADSVTPPPEALLLALDTASPTVSVAVGRDGLCLAARSVELRRSSEALLRLVDEALREAGVTLRDLDGIIALRGPGSFTGLRVGLATVLGLHQALGVAATAVPTLEVLEVAARAALPETEGPVAAVVDALRGQWFSRIFGGSGSPSQAGARAASEAAILDPEQIADLAPAVLVGHGAKRLAADPAWADRSSAAAERAGGERPAVLDLAGADWTGPTLAQAALLHHALPLGGATRDVAPWDRATLTRPLYLRAPAVSLPKRPPGRLGSATSRESSAQPGSEPRTTGSPGHAGSTHSADSTHSSRG